MLNVLNLAMCSPAENCATNRVEKKWWEMMRIDEKIIGHIMENSLYMYLLNLDIRKKVTLAKWTFLRKISEKFIVTKKHRFPTIFLIVLYYIYTILCCYILYVFLILFPGNKTVFSEQCVNSTSYHDYVHCQFLRICEQ